MQVYILSYDGRPERVWSRRPTTSEVQQAVTEILPDAYGDCNMNNHIDRERYSSFDKVMEALTVDSAWAEIGSHIFVMTQLDTV